VVRSMERQMEYTRSLVWSFPSQFELSKIIYKCLLCPLSIPQRRPVRNKAFVGFAIN
jgi:hypothetical protein